MSDEKEESKPTAAVGPPPQAAEPEKPVAAVAAPAKPKVAAKDAPIVPKKREFRWYTPALWARDFVVGTVQGFGDGLSLGAKRGFKIGMIVAAVAFFLPMAAPGLAAAAVGMGLPNIATAAGAIQFIPNGLGFFGGLVAYGLGGAAIGATLTGALGLATGGLYEIKLQRNREKYAEELAELQEMRKGHKTLGPSRLQQYETLYNRLENRAYLRQFELDQDQRAQQAQGVGWTNYVDNSRSGAGYDRGV